MQFLNPGMLALLGIIPILILIHTLKPKPRIVDVTSLFLWQEVLRERSRHITVERLKKNLPLLFQICVVILASLALAKPAWRYFSKSVSLSLRRWRWQNLPGGILAPKKAI